MSCGVGLKNGLDLLWCRLAAAALIQPLAWEPPYAAGEALKRQTNKKNYQVSLTSLKDTYYYAKTSGVSLVEHQTTKN